MSCINRWSSGEVSGSGDTEVALSATNCFHSKVHHSGTHPAEHSGTACSLTAECICLLVNDRLPTHPWKSLKVLEFFSPKFKALKVLENRAGAWKSLNFIPQVLESPWIYQVKLRDISNFINQHLYRTGMHMPYLLRNLPGILPNTRFANNCHVLFFCY